MGTKGDMIPSDVFFFRDQAQPKQEENMLSVREKK